MRSYAADRRRGQEGENEAHHLGESTIRDAMRGPLIERLEEHAASGRPLRVCLVAGASPPSTGPFT